MRSLVQEGSIALDHAVKNGVVDTAIYPFANPIITGLLKYAGDRRGLHRQDPNTFEPYEHPKSTAWQESSFEPKNHAPQTQFFCTELARFVVPRGQVGFINSIEQSVMDVNGSYYPTNQEYWGSPVSMLTDVNNIRWWLRLDYYNGSAPAAPYVFTSATAFSSEAAPGLPYPDMATIDALWYPSHLRKPVKLIIPGMRMLRFFYFSPPTTTYQWKVRGRLTGYTQSTYSLESAVNSRRLHE